MGVRKKVQCCLCAFTWRTIVPNFIPIWLEMMEPWASFKECRTTRRSRSRRVAIKDQYVIKEVPLSRGTYQYQRSSVDVVVQWLMSRGCCQMVTDWMILHHWSFHSDKSQQTAPRPVSVCRLHYRPHYIIIIIIIRHAPCQCVAPLATNSLHSDLSKASSTASSKVRLCRDRSLFRVAIQEV